MRQIYSTHILVGHKRPHYDTISAQIIKPLCFDSSLTGAETFWGLPFTYLQSITIKLANGISTRCLLPPLGSFVIECNRHRRGGF